MSTAKQVKMRRGSTLENDLFTGAEGEVTVDLTIGALRVHDGALLGGHELARADLSNVKEDSGLEQRIMEAVQALIAAGGGGGGSTGEEGMIGAVSGRFVDPGEDYVLANGELLNIADRPELYNSIGRKFGTDASFMTTSSTGFPTSAVGVNSNSLTGLAVGGTTIVASFTAGIVATSTDNGDTWVSVDTGTAVALQGVAYANGVFVVAGTNKIAYSSDGLTWTVISSVTATITRVMAFNNRFFLWAASTCYTSTDGIAWTPYTMTGFTSTVPICWFYSSLFDRYYAGGASGVLSSSADGITWTSVTSNMTNSINDIAQSPTTLVLVGGNASTVANIAYSTNGTTFTAAAVTAIASFRSSVVWHQATSKFFTVGQNLVGHYSPDGITWTAVTLPTGSFSTINSLGVSADGTTVVAATLSGSLIASTDLLTWVTRSNSSFGVYGSRSGASRFTPGGNGVNWHWGVGGIHKTTDNFTSAYWILGNGATSSSAQTFAGQRSFAYDGSNYVFNTPAAIHSDPDLGSFTYSPSAAIIMAHWRYDKNLDATAPVIVGVGVQPMPDQIQYMNGRYIAWGNFGGLSTSTDGKVWTASRAFPASSHVTKVIYASGKYIASGTGGYMFYSTNGTTWTPCTHTYGTNHIYDVHWVPQQNKFYACGDLTGHVMTSINGITWTDVNLGNTSVTSFSSIMHTNKRLAFVGGTGGKQVASMQHGDLSTLTYGTAPIKFERIDAGDQFFVCGGTSAASGGYPMIYYSSDAIGWSSVILTGLTGLAAGTITDVNWMGDGYFATGTTSVAGTPSFWSSPNGINWTQKFTSLANFVPQNILSVQNEMFTVVGSATSYMGYARFSSTPAGKFRLPNILPKNPYDPDPYIMIKK